MRSCEVCQAQMLEYVYDLLEPSERQQFQAHLDSCPPCQEALRQAQAQQGLFAAAARLEFPNVQFRQPVEQPVTLSLPTAPATPARRRAPASWRRWAAVAALLLAMGLGIPGLLLTNDYVSAQREVARGEAAVTEARAELTDLGKQLQALPREREAKVQAIREAVRERQLNVVVTGPATVQSGAPTEYRIQTTSLTGQPTPAQLTVCLADETGKQSEPLHVVSVKQEVGSYRLTLPADLPVKPNSQLTLVVSARKEGGSLASLREELPLAQPVYLTHLTTDKPMYQPGETVFFRSLTLDRATFRPAQEALRFNYTITTPTGAEHLILAGSNGLRLVDGQGKNLAAAAPGRSLESPGPDGKPVRGIGAGEFPLDPGAPGGEYILTVREAGRFPEQQRKFIVNSYQKPRLNKELDFNRKSYGAGDEVQAQCKALRADGGAVSEKDVEATVTIDGKTFDANGKESPQALKLKTDQEGQVLVRFRLPKEIEKGQASLSVKFNDGANKEAIVRPITLVLKNLQVEFFPEGGDLVAGLPNRVYFQARTPLGKPADLKGRLLEDGKALAVEIQTLSDDKEPGVNQGMGRFDFKPLAGRAYQLQVETPVGISKRLALPLVKETGVVMRIEQGVVAGKEPIKVQVHSTKERTLMVGAYCRGRLLDSVQMKKGQTEAELKPASLAGGVCRVTVFEQLEVPGGPLQGVSRRGELKPVAERLIYRQPSDNLIVKIHANQASYVPGQKALLSFETRNEMEELTPAVLMVAVVDKSVLTLADEKTARSLPTHFLLTTEVRKPEDLEYADFLLGPQAKAAQALDLLLGTQGWRRFAEQDPNKFRQAHKEEAERLLVAMGQSTPQITNFALEEINKVQRDAAAQAVSLAEKSHAADQSLRQAQGDAAYVAALKRLTADRKLLEQLRVTASPVLAALLVLGLVLALLVALRHELRRALPLYATAAACVVVLVLLAGLPRLEQAADKHQDQVAWVMPPLPGAEVAENLDKPEANLAAALEAENKANDRAPQADLDLAGDKRKAAMAPHARFPEAPRPVAMPGMAPGRGGPAKGKDAAFDEQMAKQAPFAALGKPGEMREQAAFGKKLDRFEDGARLREGKDQNGVNRQLERARRKGEGFKDLFEFQGGGAGQPLAELPTMVVREYAHQRPSSATPEMRSDFAETLYWHPVLVLPKGMAEASFPLCDSVTSFQVTAFAHTLDGQLGAATQVLDSRLPFTLEPKVPLEVTASDKIAIPLSISNNTTEKRRVNITLEERTGLSLLEKDGELVQAGIRDAALEVGPMSAIRQLYRFQPSIKEGQAVLVFKGKTDPFAADSNRTVFKVVPEGFPVAGSFSDMLEGTVSTKVLLPEKWVKGTLKLHANVYPSTLADLQKGLEGLLREPYGCFEQTSTSNYPNLLILDYLRESSQAKPEVERRARDLLARGYQKLTSFECTNTGKKLREGYEWFGGTAPAHEALTAYGLLQFRDMARVQEVDEAMVTRTKDYLLSQRDGKGGFKRNQRALDTFGRAPENITNAYIVWALTESGKDDDLAAELKPLAEEAKKSKDPYFVALVANSLLNRAEKAEAMVLLRNVVAAQKEDGHLDAARTSITGSGGQALQIETTGLVVLGWLKANPIEFKKPIDKAAKWIGQQRGGYGGFGSTQSTILALKALIAYARENKRTAEDGELTLFVDDKKVANLPFKARVAETLTLELPEAEKHLKQGVNKLRVEVTGKNVFPCTIGWTYQTLQPSSADNCPIRLSTRLLKTEAREADTVQLQVALENVSGKGQGMAVAIVGLPGGMIVPEDLKQLKEYTRAPESGGRPLISAFEIRGRELVLYWRDLAPGQKIEVPVDLICRVPGEYSGPASRAYLYYLAEHKHWIAPLQMTITTKEN